MSSILEMVKEEYTNSLSVTVIGGYTICNEEVMRWCQRQGWRFVGGDSVTGSEDQSVVLLATVTILLLRRYPEGRTCWWW